MIDLTEAAVSLHADATAEGYHTTMYLRMRVGSLIPAGSNAKNDFSHDATVDDAETNAEKLSLILLQSAHRAEAYLEETGFWTRNQRPDPETGGVLFTMENDKLQVKLVCGADRPAMKGYSINADGELGEEVVCRPYLDEIGDAPLSDFFSADDEYEDEDDFDLDPDDADEEEDSLANLPRSSAMLLR